jgi:hypothetical protein
MELQKVALKGPYLITRPSVCHTSQRTMQVQYPRVRPPCHGMNHTCICHYEHVACRIVNSLCCLTQPTSLHHTSDQNTGCRSNPITPPPPWPTAQASPPGQDIKVKHLSPPNQLALGGTTCTQAARTAFHATSVASMVCHKLRWTSTMPCHVQTLLQGLSTGSLAMTA